MGKAETSAISWWPNIQTFALLRHMYPAVGNELVGCNYSQLDVSVFNYVDVSHDFDHSEDLAFACSVAWGRSVE